MSSRRPSGSFWPDARQRLLLRAALAGERESARAWQELRPRFDLDRLDPSSYPLLPLLHRRLVRQKAEDPLLPRLLGLRRRTWYLNRLLLERLRGPLRMLEQSGAEPILVGSFELPGRYYGDLGLRRVDALRVLLRPGRLDDAVELLVGQGWELRPRAREPSWLRRGADHVFLYRRLFPDFCAPERGLEAHDPWATSVEVGLDDLVARAPGPADELLSACLGGAKAAPWLTIAWIADAMAVLSAADPSVDWRRVVDQATLVRGTLRLRAALIFLREELDAAVPDEVLEELGKSSVRRRERVAHRAEGGRWRLLGGPPGSLTRFLRVTADDSPGAALLALPTFLRDEWGLERRSQVPLAAARRSAARLRRSPAQASAAGPSDVLPAPPARAETGLGEPEPGEPADRGG